MFHVKQWPAHLGEARGFFERIEARAFDPAPATMKIGVESPAPPTFFVLQSWGRAPDVPQTCPTGIQSLDVGGASNGASSGGWPRG